MARDSTRGEPRQERSRFTVEVILDATERILARAERLTTRGIARVAGVSVGTLYQYFPGKEAAVARVIDRRLADDEARMLAVFADFRERPLEQIVRAGIESFVPESQWERALYPQLVDVLESVSRQKAVQRMLNRFEGLLTEELRQRRSELPPGLDPAEAATVMMYGLRAAVFALARSHPDLPREQVVEHLQRLAMGYLRPAGAGALGRADGFRAPVDVVDSAASPGQASS